VPVTGYTLAFLAVSALLSPGVPIVISWAHRSGVPEMRDIVSLSAATLSFLWLIAIGWRPVLVLMSGGYYVERPFMVICANLVVMLVCAAITLTTSSRLSLSTGIASVMVAVLWMSIAAIQSGGAGFFSKIRL
jgi:hypothetical protein